MRGSSTDELRASCVSIWAARFSSMTFSGGCTGAALTGCACETEPGGIIVARGCGRFTSSGQSETITQGSCFCFVSRFFGVRSPPSLCSLASTVGETCRRYQSDRVTGPLSSNSESEERRRIPISYRASSLKWAGLFPEQANPYTKRSIGQRRGVRACSLRKVSTAQSQPDASAPLCTCPTISSIRLLPVFLDGVQVFSTFTHSAWPLSSAHINAVFLYSGTIHIIQCSVASSQTQCPACACCAYPGPLESYAPVHSQQMTFQRRKRRPWRSDP